jgi:DNA helicase-2/ATP-dependent DNA helicase PcrA
MVFSILEGVYEDYLTATYDNSESRRADIEQLSEYGSGFEDVVEFLAQLSLMGAVDGEPTGDRNKPDEERVTLSSIHQAKGLEWKVVFLVWLADGYFPIGKVLDADDDAMLEEERRLFYVALTRAEDELYLTYPMMNPKSYSGDIICRPSGFLDEVPAELVEPWRVSSDEDAWSDDDPF